MYKPWWLALALLLTACGGTPDMPAPQPAPEVKAEPEPQPFENEVISVPVSPVQTLPSDW